jgi:hypothetical protein
MRAPPLRRENGSSAAGARPVAASPNAVIKATSNAARISDESPISIPFMSDAHASGDAQTRPARIGSI